MDKSTEYVSLSKPICSWSNTTDQRETKQILLNHVTYNNKKHLGTFSWNHFLWQLYAMLDQGKAKIAFADLPQLAPYLKAYRF